MVTTRGNLAGLWIFKKSFLEGETFVLFEWTREGSSIRAVRLLMPVLTTPAPLTTDGRLIVPLPSFPLPNHQAISPELRGVFFAVNGVSYNLAGAPARCLYIDVPLRGEDARTAGTSDATVPVTVAFLEAQGASICCAFEGAIVGEPAATAAVARLTDSAVALVGPGVLDEASPVWKDGTESAPAVTARARLEKICAAAAESAVDLILVSSAWADVAKESAQAAVEAEAASEARVWSEDSLVRRALAGKAALLEASILPPADGLRQAYEAAQKAAALRVGGGGSGQSAPGASERAALLAAALAAGTPLSVNFLTPPSTPTKRPSTPSAESEEEELYESSLSRSMAHLCSSLEEEAASAIAEAAHRATLVAMEDFVAEGADGAPAIGLGSGPSGSPRAAAATRKMRVLRSLKVGVHGSALALVVPGLDPVYIVDRIESNGTAALSALVLATHRGVLCEQDAAGSAALLRVWVPQTRGAVLQGNNGVASAPMPVAIPAAAAAQSLNLSLHAYVAPNPRAAEEDIAVGSSAALAFLTPPTDVLAAAGVLTAPCEPSKIASSAVPARLSFVAASVPLPLPPERDLLLPDAASLPQPLRAQLDALSASRGEEPPHMLQGDAAATARPPVMAHAVVLLVIHVPLDGDENGDDLELKESTREVLVGVTESVVRRTAAAAAMSPTVRHLGALLSWASRRPTDELAEE